MTEITGNPTASSVPKVQTGPFVPLWGVGLALLVIAALIPEFLIFPIFSNICYQNVDFRVTNGDENRFIMA